MPTNKATVAIVGGGLAGMSAAAALADRGLRVTLLEARRALGGRAGSFIDPAGGELVDHCQHVAMGCCSHFIDFARRTGILDYFRRDRVLHFIGPDGRQQDVVASSWFRPPRHLMPSLMRLKFLSLWERIRIVLAMRRLLRRSPGDDSMTMGQWLRAAGQSARAIEHFWSVVLTSALGESIERASVAAARKVFADGFAASRDAFEILVPTVPLAELYMDRVARYLGQHGVEVRLSTEVAAIEGDAAGIREVRLADGTRVAADFVILAVPWFRIAALVPADLRQALPFLEHIGRFGGSSITAAHLWFDLAFTSLPHAVLAGRTSQWLFSHGLRIVPGSLQAHAHYYQVVISASDELLEGDRGELVEHIVAELKTIWPEAADARLVHSRLVTQRNAVFSCAPGVDEIRPTQETPIPNLYLAGDWTATGWPATMEGAIRSGELAADAVIKAAALLDSFARVNTQ
jgi:squalene-associated FAD-dependent desaturase